MSRTKVFLTTILVLFVIRTAEATTYHVDDNSTVVLPTGTTWSSSFRYLQDALDVANPNDVVKVAGGIYYPDIDAAGLRVPGDRSQSFVLEDRVIVEGGYAGLADLSNPDAKNSVSILSGDIGVVGDPSDNSYHVVTGGDATTNTRLADFSITAGQGDGTGGANDKGAGIYLPFQASPAIQNCIIVNNNVGNATGKGGGLYIDNFAVPTITTCVFDSNTAGEGGAIHAAVQNVGTPIIIQTTQFRANVANLGGAIRSADNSSLDITETTFVANTARVHPAFGSSSGGGAIYSDGGSDVLRKCRFVENRAIADENNSTICGAYYHDGPNTEILRCEFIRNAAIIPDNAVTLAQVGAARLHPGGIIADCLFQENRCRDESGNDVGEVAALEVNKEAEVLNCLFFDNRAASHGTIRVSDPAVAIINCTVTRNLVPGGTAGVYFSPDGQAGSYLQNCIVYDNIGSPGLSIERQQIDAVSAVARYSDVQGLVLNGLGLDGGNSIDADPRFANPAAGAFQLRIDSPCVDAADSNPIPIDGPNDVDEDGFTAEKSPDRQLLHRVYDDQQVADTGEPLDPITIYECGVADMGAFERQTYCDSGVQGDLDATASSTAAAFSRLSTAWSRAGRFLAAAPTST